MASNSAVRLLAAASVLLGALALTKREKVYYFDFEHINITYYNPKYFKYLNFTNIRYGRNDPIHYINCHIETFYTFGNNVTVDVYFYEFLSNEYRRSFVELHFGLCEMLLTDKFMSPFLKKYFDQGCPLKAGVYHVENISFANIPLLKTFPFTKGRIFETVTLKTTGERLLEGYYDAVIKQKWHHN